MNAAGLLLLGGLAWLLSRSPRRNPAAVPWRTERQRERAAAYQRVHRATPPRRCKAPRVHHYLSYDPTAVRPGCLTRAQDARLHEPPQRAQQRRALKEARRERDQLARRLRTLKQHYPEWRRVGDLRDEVRALTDDLERARDRVYQLSGRTMQAGRVSRSGGRVVRAGWRTSGRAPAASQEARQRRRYEDIFGEED